MREIKFRAYDKDERKMYYSDKRSEAWFNLDEGKVECCLNCSYTDSYGDEHDNWERLDNLMEYTGFKDINGIEIYEGDILKITYPHKSFIIEKTGTVIYGSLGRYQIKGEDIHCAFNHIRDFKWEIIGNIYENKDLLKEDNCNE